MTTGPLVCCCIQDLFGGTEVRAISESLEHRTNSAVMTWALHFGYLQNGHEVRGLSLTMVATGFYPIYGATCDRLLESQ